ncbi:hypothetical protein [Bradyrhizobium sp. F1.13.3]|uniref:hypothetical protein n=1 Tax=Bradyrhizobium sp. F1.13.3 TaxID=3156351 RepID=UPI003399DD0A
MTSAEAVKNEIERFLRSREPEVLCITGAWGVGKTYTWQTVLDRVRAKRATGLSRYSYVSLFGISSLEGLKTAVFENMEFLLPEGSTGLERILSGGNSIVKGGKQLMGAAAALPIPYLGGALSKAQPLLFSAIRNQIVCVDDLERRGALAVKDVLGLISYLREQRSCKVVLLLNRTQLDEPGEKEFADFFEKVIDVHLVFAPTAAEAVAIAIDQDDDLSKLIREHCQKLDISNIRVVKKIERLINMLKDPVLSKFGPDVTRQVVHSMVMFGWRKLDVGANPPSIAYLQRNEFDRYLSNEHGTDDNGDDRGDHQRWDVILAQYDWGALDELDQALMTFVESSIFDIEEIVSKAAAVEANQKQRGRMVAFEEAWRPFHDGFGNNEDEVCESIIAGIRNNFEVVSRPNLDAAISVLAELGRNDDVEALLDFATTHGGDEFWTSDDPFHRRVSDPRIQSVVEERRKATGPVFQFDKDLLSTAQSMNGDKLAQLAAVPIERYQQLFENSAGLDLHNYIYAAFEYRKIGNATEDMKKVISNAEEALRRIARKSKLNEIRVRKYEISLGTPGGDPDDSKQ